MSSLPSPAPDLKARLVCRIRPGQTERFAVQPPECVVGREPGLHVTVPVDGVSRRHAKITLEGKSFWIENLSPAGTFVNGALVARERLAHLDVITLGKRVDLLFILRAEDAVSSVTEGITRAAFVPEGGDATTFEITPGEILIGRSTSNNLVAETSGAVSKVHARVERTPSQLVLRDLGSSNGTYVNGERVMTALLRHGDVVSLANVVGYRVIIERGPMPTATVVGAAIALPVADAPERALFSPEWKTRYDWDSNEIKGIAAMQARLIAEDAERKRVRAKKEAAPEKAPAAKAAPGAKAAPPAAKPSTAPAKPAPAPKAATPPPKPAPPKPSPGADTDAVPIVPPSAVDAASPARAAVDALKVQGVAPAAAMPAVVKAAVDPPPKPAVVEAPSAAVPAAIPPASEVRLTGPVPDMAVTAPGAYTLGRAKDASLRVNFPSVSRRHALLVLDDAGAAFVEDSGGANGTRLNGETIAARTRLADGDRLGIGEIELVVRLRPKA